MLQIELVNIGSCAKLLAELSIRTLGAYCNLILSHRIQPCKLEIRCLTGLHHMLPILGTSFEFFWLSAPDKCT